jgi:excisionase family DNA binding protein
LKGESDLLTVVEAAAVLRISRNLAYELIRQGRVPHLRLGKRILVPRRSLDTWIAEQSQLHTPTALSAGLAGHH